MERREEGCKPSRTGTSSVLICAATPFHNLHDALTSMAMAPIVNQVVAFDDWAARSNTESSQEPSSEVRHPSRIEARLPRFAA